MSSKRNHYIEFMRIIGITRNRRCLRILCFIVMAVSYYNRHIYYGEVIIGALIGEIVSFIKQRNKKAVLPENGFSWLLILMILMIGPPIFMATNSNGRGYILAMLFSICIGLIILTSDEQKYAAIFNKKLIILAEKNTFSFYLVHGMVLSFFGKVYNVMIGNNISNDTIGLLVIFYIISIIATLGCAVMFSRFVIANLGKVYSYIFNKLHLK